MNKKFYPSINGIYFKNFDFIEDHNGIKHIRGDLYLYSLKNEDGECIGYFNPVYQPEPNVAPKYFLRLEEEFRFLYDAENKYESIFNKNAIPLSEYDCPVGLYELIADLEVITYLYSFMNNIRPQNDFESIGMVGIINGTDDNPIVKVIQIRDKEVCTDKQIIDFINDKVDSISFNTAYPIRIYKTQNDFIIWQSDGKILDSVECEVI